jgi:hypothetical protein
MMDASSSGAAQTRARADIRRQDKALAVRLSNSKSPAQTAELLQLAAIYAALPEERRQHWFDRLGAQGVPAELREKIAERSGQLIRFPDRRRAAGRLVDHQSKHSRIVVGTRRRGTDAESS